MLGSPILYLKGRRRMNDVPTFWLLLYEYADYRMIPLLIPEGPYTLRLWN